MLIELIYLCDVDVVSEEESNNGKDENVSNLNKRKQSDESQHSQEQNCDVQRERKSQKITTSQPNGSTKKVEN